MSKLGSKEKPAIVKVQSQERAQEILALCNNKGWQVIIGLEPYENEDISDVERLLNPPKPVISEKVNRNSPCPCGSGKKFKKCCLNLK
jgi:SWIM/SEC-C metal-binding protein